MTPVVRLAGDRAALIELPDSAAVVRLTHALAGRTDLIDVVPGHCTVLVTWTGEQRPHDLEQLAASVLGGGSVPGAAQSIEIPVTYDGPDLGEVAQFLGVSPEEVVQRHVAAEYVVAFIGFAPGFAYLLGGGEQLEVPRLARPRERVPAGSVAIAGPYSGVYPRDSPGGWRLIGRTSLVLFDPDRPAPALLTSGDRVRFRRL
jgi:KipI family sensor histidine kinase inhibitor